MKNLLHFKFFVLLYVCFFSVQLAYAEDAKLFFSPVPRQVEVGERFSVSVKVGSGTEYINAISGAISFPENLVRLISVSKEKSIINLWITEPTAGRNKILFEGIVLNPGFLGNSGLAFNITFEAKNPGNAVLNFTEGAILANDGRGSNVLRTLGSANLSLVPVSQSIDQSKSLVQSDISLEARSQLLPVITKYSASVESQSDAYIRGVGEPNALTRLVFKDISLKSAGEKFITFLQTKKVTPEDVLVENNESGRFLYINANDLVAGTYNVVPFLVDTKEKTEKPGLGVELLVKESPIVEMLVVLINILVLLIPIVGLVVIIYFIPWYSFRRMRVLRKKLIFEEEKISSSEQHLKHEDEALNKTSQ